MMRDDGSRFTSDELKGVFLKMQSEGKRVFPLGDCDNFDYIVGCKGHEDALPDEHKPKVPDMTTNKLTELLQDGGSLPEVSIDHSSVSDWQRILMDAHTDLTRQLCYYMEDDNEEKVDRCLKQIEEICKAWRLKGPKF